MIAFSGIGSINAQGGWNPDPPPATPVYENCSAVDFACIARNNAKGLAYQSLLAIATYGHDGDGNGPLGYLDKDPSATPYVAPAYVASTTNVVGGSVSITPGFWVGNNWTITVTGQPNKVVSVNGTNRGSTNNNGVFILTGTYDTSQIGHWHEVWKVDGVNIGSLDFDVIPKTTTPVTNQTVVVPIPIVPQSQATGGTTSQVPTSTTQDTATNASMFDLFGTMDNNIQIAGYDVGIYTLAAAIGVIVVGSMMMSKKGRF